MAKWIYVSDFDSPDLEDVILLLKVHVDGYVSYQIVIGHYNGVNDCYYYNTLDYEEEVKKTVNIDTLDVYAWTYIPALPE